MMTHPKYGVINKNSYI